MSCSHCKGSITPVVIDESLSDMVTLQAESIHEKTRLLRHVRRLILDNSHELAVKVIELYLKDKG